MVSPINPNNTRPILILCFEASRLNFYVVINIEHFDTQLIWLLIHWVSKNIIGFWRVYLKLKKRQWELIVNKYVLTWTSSQVSSVMRKILSELNLSVKANKKLSVGLLILKIIKHVALWFGSNFVFKHILICILIGLENISIVVRLIQTIKNSNCLVCDKTH